MMQAIQIMQMLEILEAAVIEVIYSLPFATLTRAI
jgi:hypothetical protein